MMLIYVGPDQVVPAMSILATLLGFIMIFWNKVLGLFRRVLGMTKPVDPTTPPPDGNEPPKQA